MNFENIWTVGYNGFMIGYNQYIYNGYLADIQIFGRALSKQEMVDITTCKNFPKGEDDT